MTMKVGSVIGGRYLVQERIGEGGMQFVHRAVDQVIGADVAIKCPKPGQMGRRFSNSAKIAARINNHYVAKTLDYLDVSEEELHLVEELIVGETLDVAVIDLAGYVDPHLASRLFTKLAMGLAASHAAGVIHRDLKPSNILVAGGPNLSEVKITDFGIATLTDELFEDEIAGGKDLTKSTSGTVKGALPYMAPEMMFRKKGDFIGPEADVWSLGALMFEALSGEKPFGEGFMVPANVNSRTRNAWPAFMEWNDQFAALAGSLKEIIERCLSWEKADRPTALELVSLLSEVCYFSAERHFGVVENIPHVFGFIRMANSKAFFHPKNVYGPNRAKVGSNAIFCLSKGNPHPRAFPVIVRKVP